MKKLIIFISFFAISLSVQSQPSMRRCMLLPIKDYADGAVGFKVFTQVENYLKESDWCYYESNSQLLDILNNYRNNLDQHLKNPEVLKVLSQKSAAGSLIRMKIQGEPEGVTVEIKIIGKNGEDVLFKEKTRLNRNDVDLMARTFINWLEEYDGSIPFDARVIGVLGNQVTLDMGENAGIFSDDQIQILRIKRKKKHPLFKEIVDWETENIAHANVFHSNINQAQAKVQKYLGSKKTKVGDWVILKERAKETENRVRDVEDGEDYSFGRLGMASLMFNVGSGSASANTGDGETKKIGGVNFGIDAGLEIWATRNFWGGLEISRELGSYSQESGELENDSNSLTQSAFAIKAGYKYLPLGFFYGPQVDGYIGYATYSYSFDTQVNDGFTEFDFSGILLGVRASMPIIKNTRVLIGLDFMPGPSFDEEVEIYGEDESTTHFNLNIGGSYQYSPTLKLRGSLEFRNSEAKFTGPTRTLKVKDSSLRFGTEYSF